MTDFSSPAVLSWVKFRHAGVSRTQADLLLVHLQKWWLVWFAEDLFTDEIRNSEYGPVPIAAHEDFASVFPRRCPLPLDRSVAFEDVLDHYLQVPTSGLVEAACSALSAVPAGQPVPQSLLRSWAKLETQAGEAPVRPGEDRIAAARQALEAKRLRREIALRGPGLPVQET